jgi:hypothetical protein
VISVANPYDTILDFLDWSRSLPFLSSSSSVVLNEAEWAPFQTHYFSENLIAPGIEPEPLDL